MGSRAKDNVTNEITRMENLNVERDLRESAFMALSRFRAYL
jgi:hypothetical protein